MENDFITNLRNLECDIEGVMERFDNDIELFETCVGIFKDDENFEKLKECLDSSDYEGAFNCAHAIKGVAANLGLTRIFKSTSYLTEKLRHKDYTGLNELYNIVINNQKELKSIL